MATYEFGGSLCRNSTEMHTAIAVAWLSADGSNTREDMLKTLSEVSDSGLTYECEETWFNWDRGEEDGVNPAFDPIELEGAFSDIRDNFDKHFPVLPPYQP